jgi:HEAT repeat protein
MQTRTLLALMVGLLIGGVVIGEQAEKGRLPSRPRRPRNNSASVPSPPPDTASGSGLDVWALGAGLAWEAVEENWPRWRDDARHLTPALLTLLRRAEWASVRQFAASALGEIGPPGVGLADEKEPLVAGLVRALEEDDDGAVRTAALQALMRTARPTVRVLRAVGRTLRDPQKEVAVLAATSLMERKVDVLPALRAAFAGERPCDRVEAIVVAAQQGAKARPLAPALLELLRHADQEVSGAAAYALLAIGPRTFGKAVDAVLSRAPDATGANAPQIVPPEPFAAHGMLPRTVALAGKLLKSGTREEKIWAIDFVRVVGKDALCLQPLVEAELDGEAHPDSVVDALCSIGRPGKAVGRLLDAIREDGPNSHHVFGRLRYIGPAPRYVRDFVRAELHKAEGTRRVYLAACLWDIESRVVGRVRTHDPRQEALAVLIESLNDKDPSAHWSAARAIGNIGPEAARAVPHLVKWVKSRPPYNGFPDVMAFDAFTNAIWWIGPEARQAEGTVLSYMKALERLRATGTGYYAHAAWALHRIHPGHRLVVPALLAFGRKRPAYAASLLNRIGCKAPAAAPWLVRMLRSPDYLCGKAASAALWKIDPALARKVGAW